MTKDSGLNLKNLFKTETFILDVQDVINSSAPLKEPEDFFDNYQRYTDIVAFLQSLVDQYPQLVKFYPSIGQSVEGRDIPAISLSAAGFNNDTIKVIQNTMIIMILESVLSRRPTCQVNS